MKMKKSILLALVSLVMTGCASLGPQFNPSTLPEIKPGTGRVFIYRPKKFVGAAMSFKVKANDVAITKMKNGGYFVYDAAVGELEISGKTEVKRSVTLDVEAGKSYYVQGGIGFGLAVGRPKLNIVDEILGKQELLECKQLEAL